MIGKVRQTWPVRRVSAFAIGIWDTFLRDNRVIPPILAAVALLVFAWFVAGTFIGVPDETVSQNEEIAQTPDPSQSQPVPEVENPNSDSYAAYESKDPFALLFESPEEATTTTNDTSETGGESQGSEDGSEEDSGSGSRDTSNGSEDSGSGSNPNSGGNNNPQGNPQGSNENGNGGRNGGTGQNGADDARTDPTAGAADGQYGDQSVITGSENDNQDDQDDSSDGQGADSGSGGNGDLFDSGGNLPSGGRGGY